jgi:hypothetical protein
MKRGVKWSLILAVLTSIAGCTGESEKGIIKHADKPVPPPHEKQEKPEKT